jgi:hypothetical protein
MFRICNTIVIAAAALIAASGGAMANGPKCFASWSEAETVARKEALVAVEQVSTLARSSMSGAEVVKTTLCEEDGRFVYRLVVRDGGQLKTVNVDARKPFGK